jgi:Smr domain
MDRRKPRLTSLWHALDEAAFGSERTLNLRESLPSAAEARARTEVWLRARQATRAEEVLVITGRGNQSIGGIGIIRQEILGMMPSLRRRGIVASWKEHSPGSIVVKLATVNALISAPKRRRGNDAPNGKPRLETVLAGLEPETVRLLRELAEQNLSSLGIADTEAFLAKEMTHTFSTLIDSLPATPDREAALRGTIRNAIDESSGEK